MLENANQRAVPEIVGALTRAEFVRRMWSRFVRWLDSYARRSRRRDRFLWASGRIEARGVEKRTLVPMAVAM